MSKLSVLGGLWAWRQIFGNKRKDDILVNGMEEGQYQSWWDIVAHLDQISVRTSEADEPDRTFCSCPGDWTLLSRDITSLRCLFSPPKELLRLDMCSRNLPGELFWYQIPFPSFVKLNFWSSKHSAFWSPLKVVSSMPRILEENTVVSLISFLSPWCGQDYIYIYMRWGRDLIAVPLWRAVAEGIGTEVWVSGTGFQLWSPGICSVIKYPSVPLIWTIFLQSLLWYLNPLASPEYPLGVWLALPCWIPLPMNHISNGSSGA